MRIYYTLFYLKTFFKRNMVINVNEIVSYSSYIALNMNGNGTIEDDQWNGVEAKKL